MGHSVSAARASSITPPCDFVPRSSRRYNAPRLYIAWQSPVNRSLSCCLPLHHPPSVDPFARLFVKSWRRLSGPSCCTSLGEQTAATAYTRSQVVVLYPAPAHEGIPLIKRVIGVPGDTLTLANEQVTVNGTALVEPYVHGAPTSCAQYCGTVTLAAGQYFVMGDNRTQSYDSRYFGPVNEQDIIGHVILRYWPLNTLEVYP